MWHKVKISGDYVPSSRDSQCTILYDDKVYMVGGDSGNVYKNVRLYIAYKAYKDINEFNLITKKWRQIQVKPTMEPRWGHSCVCYSRFIIVFGGFAYKNLNV